MERHRWKRILAALALAVGIPVLYSYLYYRRHEKGGAQ